MKPAVFAVLFFALAAVFIGCKRENKNLLPQASGVVIFPDAGVSIDVGTGWKRIDVNPGLPVCPPTLVGSAGIVRARLFAPGISDMPAATNAVNAMFNDDNDADKNSFHQEDFTTGSGLRGQHIFYNERTGKNGSVTEMRSHRFIIQRQDGRCAAISYIATTNSDSSKVRAMILNSLKLQQARW